MAVGLMSASLLLLCLLGGLLSSPAEGALPKSLTLSSANAHGGLLRSKRANFLVEELFQGNLERECYEERCNFEEAREYFEDTEKTVAFWNIYHDGDQCLSQPCLHGGNCTDKLGGFSCSCPAPFYGITCELGGVEELKSETASAPLFTMPDMVECPTDGPTACHQLCSASYYSFRCSCLPGFQLQSDGRSCQPEVDFPCGHHNTVSPCFHGNCPWQVELLRGKVKVCNGVIVGRQTILTAARCLTNGSSEPRPSDFSVVAGNRAMGVPVRALYLHSRFSPDQYDHDLALLELTTPLRSSSTIIHLCLPRKDFSENILMLPGRTGILMGHEPESKLDVPLVYLSLDECRQQSTVSHSLTNKMFCMTKQNKGSRNENEVLIRKETARDRMGLERRQIPKSQSDSQDGPERNLRNQNVTQGSSQDTRVKEASLSLQQNQSQKTHQIWEGSGPEISIPEEERSNSSSKVRKLQTPAVKSLPVPYQELLPGTPVVTVERDTAFLTGLWISTNSDGLVFSKLSRYLSWIQPRLKTSESSMKEQMREFPETR